MASHWWSAQLVMKKAMRLPFRDRRRRRLVLFSFVLPVFVIATLLWMMKFGVLFRNAGAMFFEPDGNADPVFLQLLVWLLGSPEFQSVIPILLLPLAIWAQGAWCAGRLAIGFGYAGRLIGVYATACLASVLVLFLTVVIPLLVIFVLPIFLFVLFYFAPALTASTHGTTWRFSKAPIGFVAWCVIDFIVILMLLNIPAAILRALANAQLSAPGFGASFIWLQFASFAATFAIMTYAFLFLCAVIEGVSKHAAGAQVRVFN